MMHAYVRISGRVTIVRCRSVLMIVVATEYVKKVESVNVRVTGTHITAHI